MSYLYLSYVNPLFLKPLNLKSHFPIKMTASRRRLAYLITLVSAQSSSYSVSFTFVTVFLLFWVILLICCCTCICNKIKDSNDTKNEILRVQEEYLKANPVVSISESKLQQSAPAFHGSDNKV